jgi:hypothetical protein
VTRFPLAAPAPPPAPAVPFGGGVRSADPADVALGSYAARTARICPYLAPAMRRGQAGFTRLPLPPSQGRPEVSHVQATLFAAGLWAAEQLRERAAADRLACEVVALDWPTGRARQQAAMAWPQWALKNLLAPVGVLCGQFTPSAPAKGSRRPNASVMVLALRAAVPARDIALLARTPDLASTVVSAADDGRPLLAAVPAVPAGTDPAVAWPAVRAWAKTLPRPAARGTGAPRG